MSVARGATGDSPEDSPPRSQGVPEPSSSSAGTQGTHSPSGGPLFAGDSHCQGIESTGGPASDGSVKQGQSAHVPGPTGNIR